MSAKGTAAPKPEASRTAAQTRPETSEGGTSPNATTLSMLTSDITSPYPAANTVSELSQSEISPCEPLNEDFPSQGTPSNSGNFSPLNQGVEDRPQATSPRRQPKYLLLFFDGTAKSFSEKNTNIYRLYGALYKMNTDKQLLYYQSGIGSSGSKSNGLKRICQSISNVVEKAIARCLRDHVGLLLNGNRKEVRFAYNLYKDTSDDGVRRAKNYKKATACNAPIEFMGIWYVCGSNNEGPSKMTASGCFRDSVASVGLVGRTLPFTTYNPGIKTLREAVALDECRGAFRHYPWARTPLGSPAPDAARPDHGEDRVDGHAPGYNHPWHETDCRQVFFAGSHSGMSNVYSQRASTLIVRQFSLLWMVQEIDDAGLEIEWAHDAFDDTPTLSRYFACRGRGGKPAHASPEEKGLIQKELEKDVKGTLHESLRGLWWILEYVPLWEHFLDEHKQPTKKF
ncbi:hypothetical protein FRC00_004503, partial [Tulasnella sp. 408]